MLCLMGNSSPSLSPHPHSPHQPPARGRAGEGELGNQVERSQEMGRKKEVGGDKTGDIARPAWFSG